MQTVIICILKTKLYTPRHDFAHTFIQEYLEKSVEDYIHTDDEVYLRKGVELEKGRHQEELKLFSILFKFCSVRLYSYKYYEFYLIIN